MKLIAEHYYECLSPPMPSFTKGQDYRVFSDEFGNLVVYSDESAKTSGPVSAPVWIDAKHFKDVTNKYEMAKSVFIHEYKIFYIEVKVGQTIGRQDIFRVMAKSKRQALELFEAHQKPGYNYHIQYWES